MRYTHIIIIILLSFSFFLYGCSNRELDPAIYGLLRTPEGMQLASIADPDKRLLTIKGIADSITKDDQNIIWVPIQAEKLSGESDKVVLIKGDKIIHTIKNSINRPIKIVEGPPQFNLNAIIYLHSGLDGKIVFIDKKTYKEEKTIDLKGYLTDAIFDSKYLYVTSDNPNENQNSTIYKINLSNFNITSVKIENSVRLTSLVEEGDFIYSAAAAMLEKTASDGKTYLFKIRKDSLSIVSKFEVLRSPINIQKHKNKLFILHMSYGDSPMWGGKVSVYHLDTEKLEEINIPYVADKMLFHDDKIIFSSSVSDGSRIPEVFIEMDTSNYSYKEVKGKRFFTNLVKIT
ncbi:hypothetical protein QFZ81_003668 [Paenibacillus sp. V4I9]|uniref:YncE family protein n=1 Tax=Paenibacillus sp. V4I9 TaxID=3042308 RepID=UPI00278786AF|nr:hypothetical protein [Paenibacillus sp. V4I9]MDQ0888580.1 hypothetical protein [Paenibacillus sp. V4I9]